MKLALFVGLLSVGMFQAAKAQSLDIGGIELRLGQKVDEALRSLSSYHVRYSSGSWIVTQTAGEQFQVLGSISATDNVISFINKSFDTSSYEGVPEAYTRASKEVRRRGGMACVTGEVRHTDNLIRSFQTWCGPYELSYLMPFKTADGRTTLSGVSISIRKQ